MRKRQPSPVKVAILALPLGLGLVSSDAHAAPSLADYKYFRALSIDLLGRMPTRQELQDFERPDFSVDQWLDAHLQGDQYAARLTRVYSDLMRPQVNNFRYTNNRNTLSWATIVGPDGNLTRIYWRPTQLRQRTTALKAQLNNDALYKQCLPLSNMDLTKEPQKTQYATLGCSVYETYDNMLRTGGCMTADEMGIRMNSFNFAPIPFPTQPGDVNGTTPRTPVSQQVLDQNTTVVKPWWLYADYRSASPTDRYDATSWAQRYPGFVPATGLLKEPDNKTDTMTIRVCNEEANTALTAPADSASIKTPVNCTTGYGELNSSACGCGPGLEWCMPSLVLNYPFPAGGFVSSNSVMLGVNDPTNSVALSFFDWQSMWISQEFYTYLNRLFSQDQDFTTIVTGRHTYVNGPLAQFYRFSARSYWTDASMGQTPLPGQEVMPPDLLPQDVATWVEVPDRGPNAAGILTMPWYLMKNATRRARGHSMYNTFLCRDFVAPQGLQLPISTQVDLTRRQGCAACHQTLEPLASYFSRVVESDWNFLDPKLYPAACKSSSGGLCSGRYDVNFPAPAGAGYYLGGAYAAPDHTDAGPAGAGAYLTSRPEFYSCAAQNIAQDFLGRTLRTEDQDLIQQMTDAMTQNGNRVKPMVKVLLNSNAYRSANNLASTVWRMGGGQ